MQHSKTYAASLAHGDEDDEELEQEPESVAHDKSMGGKEGHASIGIIQSEADGTIEPPDTLDEEFDLYKNTGFVSAAVHQYADDVTMPGVRFVADSEETEEWMNETFLPQAGIVGGQRHQEFSSFLYQDVIQYLGGGNILNENVKDPDGNITGFLHINPASCKAETENNRPILRSPDAVEKDWWEDEYPTTDDGKAAAFVQYHPESVLGQKGRFDDRDEIKLSLDDVTYQPRTPPAGEIWGIPITRNIKEELTEFKNIRRDLARAIRTKAWGIWTVGFETDVIETKDEVFIEDWSNEEMDNFTSDIGSMDPGEIIGHDGSIKFDKHQGEVPEEVLEVLEAYVKLIVAALPPPLYAIGFEDNINQFVVREQEKIYEASVNSMQDTLSQTYSPTLRQVCRDHGKDPSGGRLELAPQDDESPIRTMETDDLEKFALYADGLSALFGEDAYRAFNPEHFAELVALLPEEAFKTEAFVGVPGGIPGEVEKLPILDVIEEAGKVDVQDLASIREDINRAMRPDENPSSDYINPFMEQTGSGEGGIFGSGDPGDDGEREPERNPDGTLAGSS